MAARSYLLVLKMRPQVPALVTARVQRGFRMVEERYALSHGWH